jgi:tetratricopeptide (TPR) repeat protein
MIISEESGSVQALQGKYSSLIPPYLLGGALEQAEQWADKLYALREDFMPTFQTFFFVNIARVKIALEKLREGKAVLEHAFADFDKEGLSAFATAPLFVADGHLQLALGNPERTRDRMEALIQRLHHIGSRYYLAEAHWLQGKALLALEEIEQAREALLAAKAAAEVNSERTVLWQILANLARIEAVIGNPEEAASLRSQTQEVITYIANHAGSDDLRASFLKQPDVKRIFDKTLTKNGG